MKISIVIAVFNEEANVRPLVEQLADAMQGQDYEIIYVDDGSTDGTLSELRSLNHERLKIIE
ncbi:MAG: glycosyltransferase, partial [Bacteroidota bacterium]